MRRCLGNDAASRVMGRGGVRANPGRRGGVASGKERRRRARRGEAERREAGAEARPSESASWRGGTSRVEAASRESYSEATAS